MSGMRNKQDMPRLYRITIISHKCEFGQKLANQYNQSIQSIVTGPVSSFEQLEESVHSDLCEHMSITKLEIAPVNLGTS